MESTTGLSFSFNLRLSTGRIHARLIYATMRQVPPRLSTNVIELLTAQSNVIAVWQLDDGRAARRAHALGHWRELTPRVYAAAPSEPTEEQLIWAAALHAGPLGRLAGQAALFGSGWEHDVARPFDVVVPAELNPGCPEWITLHRTTRVLTSPKGGMPRTPPAQACLDAVVWCRTDREAVFVLITALKENVVEPPDLLRELKNRPTMPRRHLVSETVDEFTGGAMSMGELDFAKLCREYGIRPPDRQVRRKSAQGTRFLDCYWDAERVVVEIDGAGHADIEVMRDDHERQNDVVLQGDRIFLRVFTWVLRYEPEVFMSQLAQIVGKVE